MKAILMSIRPQWVAKILNKEKTIEIRKRFPKDYVGLVYIYNAKDKNFLCRIDNEWNTIRVIRGAKFKSAFAGKVVARFWCDKVEELTFLEGLYSPLDRGYCTDTLDNAQVEIKSCVPQENIIDYLYTKGKGYAIHITKLEIFDKPKEIREFWGIGKKCKYDNMSDREWYCDYCKKPDCIKELTRAPQSWCYVEV